MELVQDFVQNQFIYVTVFLVVFFAILVFVFGIQKPKEPAFAKLTNEDKKQQNKKRKIKEKKPTANGNVTTGQTKTEKSPQKETKRSPQKEVEPLKKKTETNNKVAEKNKTNEIKNTVSEDQKSKKNLKKILNEKPADFDEGGWETVPAKGEKKKKVESPAKKEKKPKKSDKPTGLEKIEKDSVNKELQTESEKEVSVEKVVEEVKLIEEIPETPMIIEDKKEKKKEKKVKKEKEPPKVQEPEINIVAEEMKPVKPKPALTKPKPVEIIKPDNVEFEVKPALITNSSSGGVAFDELGDVWTEAKTAKKSKKKTRKDN